MIPEDQAAGPETSAPVYRWYHKAAALLFVNFCFFVGVVLTAFPWLPWWDHNFFGGFSPAWRMVWLNPFFRGAVSGVGLLDLYISLVEIFRLRRFTGIR